MKGASWGDTFPPQPKANSGSRGKSDPQVALPSNGNVWKSCSGRASSLASASDASPLGRSPKAVLV